MTQKTIKTTQEHKVSVPKSKKIEVSLEQLRKVFTANEHPKSTLRKIDQAITENLHGFLGDTIVTSDYSLEKIEGQLKDFQIPNEPILVSEQSDFLLKNIVKNSVHTAAPSFVGHMTSSIPYFMLPISRLMIALNQNLVKIETSKAFTPLEKQVIAMIHHLIYNKENSYYKNHMHSPLRALGLMCSGGTVANITALWVARNKLLTPKENFDGVERDGILQGCQAHGFKDLVIIGSELAHYSISKCAGVLGIGRKNIKKIPCGRDGKMLIPFLKESIEECKKQNLGIIGVVGLAGATEIGSVDNLTEISEICQENKIHFHVDAAWGGPTMFSKKHAKQLAGIELADSVTIDCHKQLYTPMGAGICLFKDPADSHEIRTTANYIIREGSRDLGKFSLEGSRPGMAILIHSALKILGHKGYEMLIDHGIELTKFFAQKINESEDFEVISNPQLNIMTYRWLPKKLRHYKGKKKVPTEHHEALNRITIAIQKRQRDHGKSFVSRTTLNYGELQNTTVFRVVLANPLTTKEILSNILKEQRKLGKQIMDA